MLAAAEQGCSSRDVSNFEATPPSAVVKNLGFAVMNPLSLRSEAGDLIREARSRLARRRLQEKGALRRSFFLADTVHGSFILARRRPRRQLPKQRSTTAKAPRSWPPLEHMRQILFTSVRSRSVEEESTEPSCRDLRDCSIRVTQSAS